MQSFRASILRVVQQIPKGRTLTYGEVAERAGFPGSARAVGSVLRGNVDPAVPCHRVIRTDGTVGQYNRGGEKRKTALLKKEGVLR